jgi:TPP-dependent pyruvate/acetoin dehydrogenase alpha subunit
MNHCTKAQLIAFSKRIFDVFETGEVPFKIHMSGGNEDELIPLFHQVQPGDWVFSTHRSHYHFLLSGGHPDELERMIREGRSMFVFGRQGQYGLQANFLTSSILAGMCCIAAGVALQLKNEESENRCWCFIGDGAEDQGHFAEAVMYVHGNNLPCTFIIENNNRSVDTSETERFPQTRGIIWPPCVYEYAYVPAWQHGGTGTKTWVKFKPEIVEKFAR